MNELGFCPERTRLLAHRVEAALDELATLACSDPAAADALRVVSLTVHNLRTSWIPLLDRIAATDALIRWTAHDLSSPSHGSWSFPRISGSTIARLANALLLTRLRGRAGGMRHDQSGHPLPGDADGAWLDGLTNAIRLALVDDPSFRGSLLDAVAADPQLAWLLLSDELDAALRADILVVLLSTVGRVHGYEWEAVAGAADELMIGLSSNPAEALRVVGDPDTLALLAEWPPLDQEVVAEFVHRALVEAVRHEPDLHADGIGVIASLVELANQGRLDHVGFGRGMSIGVASAIGAYVPSFIDTVRLENATVAARSDGPDEELDVTLGSYEELVEFFGAVMRDSPAAQEILGAELASITRLAISDADGVPGSIRVDTVAEMAELLQHAAANENEEDLVASAARRAALLDTSTLLGFTTTALFLVTKAGNPIARFLLDRGVKDLVDLAIRPAPSDQAVSVDLATATHQMIVAAAVQRVAADPGLRSSSKIGGSDRAWAEVHADLEELEELAADGAEVREIDRRLYQLEADARSLGAGDYLDELLRRPAVHDLTSASRPDS